MIEAKQTLGPVHSPFSLITLHASHHTAYSYSSVDDSIRFFGECSDSFTERFRFGIHFRNELKAEG